MIDEHLLEGRCRMKRKHFRKLGKFTRTSNEMGYVHIDRGGSVLAVAHVDVVNNMDDVNFVTMKGKRVVVSGALDDRLGAYVILDLLPKLGVVCDVLLTDGEEAGASTGADFKTDKQYNWIFSFDRRGTDVVLYAYDCRDLRSKLEAEGLEVGQGSFSDISSMQHLGVKAFNMGTGYHSEHSEWCHADLEDVMVQAHKFARFWRAHKDTKLDHKQVIEPKYWRTGFNDMAYGQQLGWESWSPNRSTRGTENQYCWYCGQPFPMLDTNEVEVDGEVIELCDTCVVQAKDAVELNRGRVSRADQEHYTDVDGICICGRASCSYTDLDIVQQGRLFDNI